MKKEFKQLYIFSIYLDKKCKINELISEKINWIIENRYFENFISKLQSQNVAMITSFASLLVVWSMKGVFAVSTRKNSENILSI